MVKKISEKRRKLLVIDETNERFRKEAEAKTWQSELAAKTVPR